MTFDEYQQKALRTASRKGEEGEMIHRVLGLVGEAGEFAEKVKKVYRDQDGKINDQNIADFKKELGDTLWYLAMICEFFDFTIEEVAQLNIEKMASRKTRGKIGGSGDNR